MFYPVVDAYTPWEPWEMVLPCFPNFPCMGREFFRANVKSFTGKGNIHMPESFDYFQRYASHIGKELSMLTIEPSKKVT